MSEPGAAQPPTLADLFGSRKLTSAELAEIARSEALEGLREELSGSFKGAVDPATVLESMLQRISDLLGVELPDMLARAWRRSEEIREYADPDDYPPDEAVLVPLAEHVVTSSHRPSFEPRLNEVELPSITFDVELELKLEGVVLRIGGGRILGFHVGSCQGRGTVALAGQPLLEREGERLEFPGFVDLGDGLPIRVPDAPELGGASGEGSPVDGAEPAADRITDDPQS